MYQPIARAPNAGTKTSDTYGIPTARSPGKTRPWIARMIRSASNVGASATAIDAGTSNALAAIRQARRPTRSDSGPQIHDPATTATMSTEIVSPARLGVTANTRPISGRMPCVEYIVANIALAPTRNPAIAPNALRGVGVGVHMSITVGVRV